MADTNTMEKFVRNGATLHKYLTRIGLNQEAQEFEYVFSVTNVLDITSIEQMSFFLNQDEVILSDLLLASARIFPEIVFIIQTLIGKGPAFADDLSKLFPHNEIERAYLTDHSIITQFLAFNFKAYSFLTMLGLPRAAANLKEKINLTYPDCVIADDGVRQLVEGGSDPTDWVKFKFSMFRQALVTMATCGCNIDRWLAD